MATTTQIDDRNLNNALRALAKITGMSFRDVVRYETGKILESAVKKTRAAKVAAIRKSVLSRTVTSVQGKRYYMRNRYSDSLWKKIQDSLKRSIRNRLTSRGLSKKSWKQLAEKLGITIAVPAYVAKATARTGDHPSNAKAAEKKSGQQFGIVMVNERTYDPKIVSAIRSAMGSRTAYFKRNLKNDVFKKASDIAARYPGLRAS